MTAPQLLPSRILHHQLICHLATGQFKCPVLLMSLHPLVSLCPSIYVTKLHLCHLTYLLHHMLAQFNLQPCSMLTPPPAYCFRLMLCMMFTWYLHRTIPLHPNQCTHNVDCLTTHVFLFFFFPISFILCSYTFIGPIALALACYIVYCPLWIGDSVPLCFPLVSSHELHLVHTVFLFGCFVDAIDNVRAKIQDKGLSPWRLNRQMQLTM